MIPCCLIDLLLSPNRPAFRSIPTPDTQLSSTRVKQRSNNFRFRAPPTPSQPATRRPKRLNSRRPRRTLTNKRYVSTKLCGLVGYLGNAACGLAPGCRRTGAIIIPARIWDTPGPARLVPVTPVEVAKLATHFNHIRRRRRLVCISYLSFRICCHCCTILLAALHCLVFSRSN